jgi:hydroxylamine dehydrogenase
VSFRSVFIAIVIETALLVAAFVVNWFRPRGVTEQPSAALVRASGKCAECHANLQYSVVKVRISPFQPAGPPDRSRLASTTA